MGYVSTEQTVAIIEAVGEAKASPEPTNYWWLLLIAVAPVVLTLWFKRKK